LFEDKYFYAMMEKYKKIKAIKIFNVLL